MFVRPVVIVHGAFHQPLHYRSLVDALTAAGRVVAVPDVGMLALSDSVLKVQAVVEGLDEAPIVVGHSFGGACAGGLTGIHSVIFLTGWVLDIGESAIQFLDDARFPGGEQFASALRPSPARSTFSIDSAAARDLFYNDCSDGDALAAVDLLRPDTAANFPAIPVRATWNSVPTLYVRATQDNTWPVELDSFFASRCTSVESVPTGHSPFISRPRDVVELIDRQD